MAVVFGLVPALTIESDVKIGPYVLCPVHRCMKHGVSDGQCRPYAQLAVMYGRAHALRPATRAVFVQRRGTQPKHLNTAACAAAIDCLAFSAVCAGRSYLTRQGGLAIAYPDCFHVSPIQPHPDGGFVTHTSWQLAYSTTASRISHPWPVATVFDAHAVRWDTNLNAALDPVLKRITKRSPDRTALQIVRGIALMNHACRGFGEGVLGHAEQARYIAFAVAAFETACSTGARSTTKKSIIERVNSLDFYRRRLTNPNFTWRHDQKTKQPLRTGRVGEVVHWAYEARNDFMHGNPISPSALRYKRHPKRPPLVPPLVYVFRKLIISLCSPFGGLDLTPPPISDTASITSPQFVREWRQWSAYGELISIENEYDELLSKMLK